MQTLYLVRHTKAAVEPGVCYGQLDVDVADTFGEEAAAVLDWLPPVELIITSPLQRTRRLAGYLASRQGCTVHSDRRLMEMHFGDWEGSRWNDIPRCEIDSWSADILNYAPPNGESPQNMLLRVERLLHDVTKLTQKQVALVAHAGSIRALLALLGGVPLTRTLNWQIEVGTVIGVHIAQKHAVR
jgi:alpha-ribazole phosphatase